MHVNSISITRSKVQDFAQQHVHEFLEGFTAVKRVDEVDPGGEMDKEFL